MLTLDINRRYKHFQRYREITGVLLKYGLAYFLRQAGLGDEATEHRDAPDESGREVHGSSAALRLRLALEELGPTFVKLGQILSTRPDLLPQEYIREFDKLQDSVHPFDPDLVKGIVEQELGRPFHEAFPEFTLEPLAAASIGQVHRAVLADGQEVVVKVQRPGVQKQIETDIDIMYYIARLLEKRAAWARIYNLVDMVTEFDRVLHEELDYYAEGRSADIFRKNYTDNDDILIPRIFWDHSTRKVLTMEYVPGTKLTNLDEIDRQGLDRSALAANLTQAFLKQMLEDGFFHGDPHPGNLAAQAGNRIVFFDFGIIGHLTEETRERIGSLLIALVGRDIEGIMEAFIDLSLAQSTINRSLLRRDIDRMLFKYYEIPLADLNLGEILDDVMILAKKHNLQMPSEFALMAKALLTLEGVDRELDPALSIMKIAEPLTRKLLTDRYGPRQIIRHAFRHAHEYGRIFKALPSLINDVLTGVKSGELPVNLQVRHDYTQNQELLRKVSTMVNRLAMSIIIASLIMGSALLSQGNNFFLRQFPIAEAVFLLAGVMAAALFVSIFRSGRF